MRKSVFTLAFVLCVVVSSFALFGSSSHVAKAAHASTKLPQYKDCSRACVSNGFWDGSNSGAYTQFTLSNPGINISGGWWERYLNINNDTSFLRIGIEKDGSPNTGICHSYPGNKLYYFAEADNQLSGTLLLQCNPVPAGDINKDIGVRMELNASNGMLYDFFTPSGQGACGTSTCGSFNQGTVFSDIVLTEAVKNTWSGENVYGSHWLYSQYVDAHTRQFNYQPQDFTNRFPANPPQMYWYRVPAPGNNGGDLQSCVYDTGTTCNYGR